MKLNICILIAIFIICHVVECLGDPPNSIIIKGNVQEIDEKSRTCKPAENVKFTVFIDLDKSKVLENKDTSSFYTIDKKGEFKTNMYVIPRDYARNGKIDLEQKKWIPPIRIEIVAIVNVTPEFQYAKRLVYNTDDLDMTLGKDGQLIFEIPVVDLTRNAIGLHCGEIDGEVRVVYSDL